MNLVSDTGMGYIANLLIVNLLYEGDYLGDN